MTAILKTYITKLKRKTAKNNIGESNNLAGYIFISPWLIGFFAFTIVPVLMSFVLSFSRYDLIGAPEWIGLQNYKEMFFNDPLFWKSIGITFFYVFVHVPLRLAFALLVAVLLYNGSKLNGFYRSIFYMPSVIGGSVAVAVMWRQIFGLDGAVNSILLSLGIIDNSVGWLGQPSTAIWSLILLAVWQFGSPMLIFIAGLKQISGSYYEAADVDGANSIQKFFKVTIPLLTPIILFNFIMQMIHGFMSFTQAYIITEGGPLNSTLFYGLYLFQKGFLFNQMGYAYALAWVLLVIMGIFTAIIFKSSSYWVFYESEGE